MDIQSLPDLALLQVLSFFSHEEKIRTLMLVSNLGLSSFFHFKSPTVSSVTNKFRIQVFNFQTDFLFIQIHCIRHDQLMITPHCGVHSQTLFDKQKSAKARRPWPIGLGEQLACEQLWQRQSHTTGEHQRVILNRFLAFSQSLRLSHLNCAEAPGESYWYTSSVTLDINF